MEKRARRLAEKEARAEALRNKINRVEESASTPPHRETSTPPAPKPKEKKSLKKELQATKRGELKSDSLDIANDEGAIEDPVSSGAPVKENGESNVIEEAEKEDEEEHAVEETKLVEQNEDAEAVKDDVEEDQGMLGDVGVDRNVDEMAVEENRDAEENGGLDAAAKTGDKVDVNSKKEHPESGNVLNQLT